MANNYYGSEESTTNWGGMGGKVFGSADNSVNVANQHRMGQQYQSDIQKQIADSQLGFQQQKFNTVFPWLQGQFGNLASQWNSNGGGGSSGKSPEITVGGVWNPQQIQQQVNATRAGNDQKTASTMRGQTANLAGQGFGASSPLLAALHGQAQAANLGTNTQAEQQFRNEAAKANAGQLLNTQQARETQFANRQGEQIARQKNTVGMYSALLSALGGFNY